jgi:hypothetical protein
MEVEVADIVWTLNLGSPQIRCANVINYIVSYNMEKNKLANSNSFQIMTLEE